MKECVFLFPGQGSQAVGMGKDLAANTEFGRKTFKLADEILGYSLSKICFDGPEEELKLTHNTQPALLTVSYILYQLFEKQPLFAAGHSLGEYSALVCAGALSFEDAVLLVHKRGKYMQEAVPVGKGSMAAVIGLSYAQVTDVLKTVSGNVSVANWNSENQIVISGEKQAVESAAASLSGAKIVFLPVSAPFHSALMLPAEEKLKQDLLNTAFYPPAFPVINNVEVKEVKSGEDARQGLIMQVSRPVLWHSIMKKLLLEKQVTQFAEIGTGTVLSGILKRTAKELNVTVEFRSIKDLASLKI
jgi:[acyl-carrier-protein] S-malonyltransferase